MCLQWFKNSFLEIRKQSEDCIQVSTSLPTGRQVNRLALFGLASCIGKTSLIPAQWNRIDSEFFYHIEKTMDT